MKKKFFIGAIIFMLMFTCINNTFAKDSSGSADASAIESANRQIVSLDEIRNNPDIELVQEADKYNYSYIPSKNISKNAYIAKYNKVFATTEWRYFDLEDAVNTYYKGSLPCGGYIYDGFDSGVGTTSDWNYINATVAGNSVTMWSGLDPYNANSIDQTDAFTFEVWDIDGITISYPPGLDIDIDGCTVVLNYPTVHNTWRYNHTYNAISCEAFDITHVTQCSSVTYLFGSATFSTMCTKRILVY